MKIENEMSIFFGLSGWCIYFTLAWPDQTCYVTKSNDLWQNGIIYQQEDHLPAGTHLFTASV
jgi:hypothetical protein